MKKRLMAMLLAVMMIFSLLPTAAFAEEGQDASPANNESPEVTQPCEECVDEDEDGLCDVCGEAMQQEDPAEEPVEEEIPLGMTLLGSVAETDVASIGDNGYATLDAALAAIPDDNSEPVTIELLANVELTSPLTIAKKNVVINGNSKFIKTASNFQGTYNSSNASYGPMVVLTGAENITFNNITFDGGNYADSYKFSLVGCGKNIAYSGCTFQNARHCQYYGSSTGTLTFTKCTINTKTYGINQSEGGATVVITGCNIKGYNSFGSTETVTITNTNFAKSDTTTNCNLRFYGNATVTGCSFSSYYVTNETFDCGGGANGVVTVNNCTVETEGKTVADAISVGAAKETSGSFVFAIDAAGDAQNGYTKGTFIATNQNLVTAAEGYSVVKVEGKSNRYTIVSDKTYVAQIGETKYETLAEAVSAATAGQTITLLVDVTENITVAAGKNITIDLAGYTINGGNQTTANKKPAITNNGTLTIKDTSEGGTGTIKREDTGSNAYYVIANNGTLTIESGNVINTSGTENAHAGASLIVNGDYNTESYLYIKGGHLEQTNFNVIKGDTCNGLIEITGGTIVGDKTAIMSYGNVNIKGGSVTGYVIALGMADDEVANEAHPVFNISGGTFTNSVLSVSYYSTYKPSTLASMNITGGQFSNCDFGVGPSSGNKYSTKDSSYGTLSISGGIYDGTSKNNAEGYIAEGKAAVSNTDSNTSATYPWMIADAAAAVISGETTTYYSTLAAALEAANTNDTVKLLADVTAPISITKSITFDLNGKTVTSSSSGISVSGGANVTITGNGTVKAAYSAVSASGDNTKVTIENGHFAGNTTGNVTLIHAYEGATLTINGGEFNSKDGDPKEQKVFYAGANSQEDGNQNKHGKIIVTGGTFSGRLSLSNWGEYEISGGTFNKNEVQNYTNPESGVSTKVSNPATLTLEASGMLKSGYTAVQSGSVWVIEKITQTAEDVKVDVNKTATAEVTVDAAVSVPEEITLTEDQKAAVESTTVTGVKLTEDGTDSGMQTVVDTAMADVTTEVKTAITDASNVEVKVHVTVNAELKEKTEAENASTVTFKLEPKATVQIYADDVLKVSKQDIDVTNEMIDQTQDIVVTFYTGFNPARVEHTDDAGNLIDFFTGDDIVYDETTGMTTVIIHHFSELKAYEDVIQEAEGVKYSATLTLNDNTDINFYVKFPSTVTETERNKYSVVATFQGETRTFNLSSMTGTTSGDTIEYKCASICTVFSYQMTFPVSIVVKYDGNVIHAYEYSVLKYCTNMLSADDTGLVDLCKALLDYGANAQQYFNGKSYYVGDIEYAYDTDVSNLANKATNASNTISATKPASVMSKSGSIDGISDYSASLILGSETSVKFYFSGDITDCTVKVNDTVVTPKLNGNKYEVTCSGIKSFNLGKTVTLTITKGDNTVTLNYSPYSYANRNWDNASIGKLCQALTAYGTKSSTYFAQN